MVVVNMFIEIPANKSSLARRKLVIGVGINDAPYKVTYIENGVRFICPYYHRWQGMLRRVYCKKALIKKPAYIGTSVCKEWHYFMAFRAWMIQQKWEGLQLDKDIIKPGNKVYCPEHCGFVTSLINNLLVTCAAARGKYPQGVVKTKTGFRVQIRISGNDQVRHLGVFDTPEEAANTYNTAKSVNLFRMAEAQTDARISKGLMRHAQLYKKEQIND